MPPASRQRAAQQIGTGLFLQMPRIPMPANKNRPKRRFLRVV